MAGRQGARKSASPARQPNNELWQARPDQEVSDTEDEEAVEQMERFERDFNFRFEEEGGTEAWQHSVVAHVTRCQIKSYPRTIDNSLRRDDSNRKDKRKEKKLRKKEARCMADDTPAPTRVAGKAEEGRGGQAAQGSQAQGGCAAAAEDPRCAAAAPPRWSRAAEITGAGIEGLQNIDLDGDFQPDEFDRQMAVRACVHVVADP